jgi:hypothetical protein
MENWSIGVYVRSVVIYLTPSLDTMTASLSANAGAREVISARVDRNAIAEHDRGKVVVESTAHDDPSVQAL